MKGEQINRNLSLGYRTKLKECCFLADIGRLCGCSLRIRLGKDAKSTFDRKLKIA